MLDRAFSMVEMLFAILILAVLSSIALPYFLNASDDARLNEIRSAILAIRAQIAEHASKRIISGATDKSSLYPASLDADSELFGAVLPFGAPKGWSKGASAGVYKLSFNYGAKPYEAIFYYCSCATFAADKSGRAAETCDYNKNCTPKTTAGRLPALGAFLCAYKTAKADTPEACKIIGNF